ncbi:MAG: bifunctional UDP-sugar hydrolase/5'-nucleotidase [Desulfovibrionaceae bacterium]
MALAALLVVISTAPASAFELTVAHLNDSHSYLRGSGATLTLGSERTAVAQDGERTAVAHDGERTAVRLGGWDRLATAVRELRARRKNVALLHAGDAVQGDLYFMRYPGRPEMELLDKLGFDAFTLGNHEFDNGPAFLAGMLEPLKTPVLAANMAAPALPGLASRVRPYVVLEYGAEQVGVIGLITRYTSTMSSSGPDVSFADEADTARQYVRELTARGIDKIILLTHLGLEADLRLARRVEGVDLIVGGHSHSLLGDEQALEALGLEPDGPYPMAVTGADGHPVYVVTAWKWGRLFPVLDLEFDDSGHVTSARGSAPLVLADSFRRKNASGRHVELAGEARRQLLEALRDDASLQVVERDKSVAAWLEPISRGVDALRGQVIGTAAEPLPHVRRPTAKHPEGSMLAPHVCASMLRRMERSGQHADAALLNSGGLRDGLPEGDISIADAYTLLPFANTLHLLRLSGAQLLQALESGLARDGGAFPYLGGARYEADMNRPEGQRVLRVEMLERGAWTPLDPARTYGLVVNSYVSRGGDGYAVLKPLASPETDTGFTDTQAFIDYVQETGRLRRPGSSGVKLLHP